MERLHAQEGSEYTPVQTQFKKTKHAHCTLVHNELSGIGIWCWSERLGVQYPLMPALQFYDHDDYIGKMNNILTKEIATWEKSALKTRTGELLLLIIAKA